MITGLKCEGCRMWTRLELREILFMSRHGLHVPYYCLKCFENVTTHTTKARITLE